MLKLLFHIGRYFVMLKRVFSRPERGKVFFRQTIREVDKIGLSSILIVIIISIFMGAVCTIQMTANLANPIIPRYLIGLGTRETMLLEFSSTIVALILSGKVGGNIASELGTMKVTEQVDALEMMGVNSASYLILPKITASIFFIPLLTIISMAVGIIGGYLAAFFTPGVTPHEFVIGITSYFQPYYVTYSIIKSSIFAFIISSISSYHGYFTNGGALDVGKSSTHAVVYSSIVVLLFNVILTKLML
ncbi:MAG: ABC transporter permease [Bacteroidales bacterium]|nr:ABC transporter permease [Bacteroidales bacterium]